jgi:hypothetical protein
MQVRVVPSASASASTGKLDRQKIQRLSHNFYFICKLAVFVVCGRPDGDLLHVGPDTKWQSQKPHPAGPTPTPRNDWDRKGKKNVGKKKTNTPKNFLPGGRSAQTQDLGFGALAFAASSGTRGP